MFGPTEFRELVSGRARGWQALLLRAGLRMAEVPYTWAMRVRNWRYNCHRAAVFTAGVPVVSIGNLSLGGTGKTPLVEWLARQVRQADVRVAILSRGYGRHGTNANDEALELALALPDVPHIQNPDRVAGARIAVQELGAQLLLLDDGFQHRRLARDLDIVLLDASEPFGYGHVFPRGTLREPLRELARAHVVVLSRADMLTADQRSAVKQRVQRLAPAVVWSEVRHHVVGLTNCSGQRVTTELLAEKRIAAFCGIGNPAGFRHTLESLGCSAALWREFPDHHQYTSDDVRSLSAWAQDADILLCTRKDLVKLNVPTVGAVPLWAVAVEIEFLAGQQAFEQAVASVVQLVA